VKRRLVWVSFAILVMAAAWVPAATARQQEPQTDPSAEVKSFPLWPGKAPGALGESEEDRPTLTVYRAADGNDLRPAVIVFPGGGYRWLAMNHEGRQIANWLNAMGITAFVLRYRLGPKYHHPVELGDAQRAIRTVRARAADFHVLPNKIGVLGFSAGGHLASTTGTHFDAGNASSPDPIERASSRPDFLVLAYPVISMTASYSHTGSRDSLLGEHPSAELAREMSGELNVSKDTPPTFLFSSTTDTVVPPENSVAFYLALRKAGVPAELHIFENAPHGVGLDLEDPAMGSWGDLLIKWLRVQKVLTGGN